MAWKQVKVKIGKSNVDAMYSDDDNLLENLDVNIKDVGDGVKVDGADMQVASSVLNADNLVNIKLAVASPKPKEKSEDDGSIKKAE